MITKQHAIEEIWNEFNEICNDSSKYSSAETTLIKKVFSRLQKRIEKTPNDYDINKVINELNENIPLYNSKIRKIVENGGKTYEV